MKKRLPWLCAALIVTIIFGMMYGLIQQVLRQGANDPQQQIADDTAQALRSNAQSVKEPDPNKHVDMAKSLDVFTIIYDQNGTVLVGNGYLDGVVPKVPFGVLTHTTSTHDHTLTWQPRNDVRIAIVVAKAGDHYVLSGRSLKEVENRIGRATTAAATAWLASLAILAVGYRLYSKPSPKK